MATIARVTSPKTGDVAIEAYFNTDLDTVYTEINGNLDNDNIDAAAAIAISKTALGTYTVWTTYAPTFDASGTMTFTSVTAHIARYCQIGKLVTLQIYATGTTGGTAAAGLRFSLPIAPAYTTTNYVGGGCMAITTGDSRGGFFAYSSSSSKVVVYLYDQGDYGLGASTGFSLQMTYEVA